MWSIRFATVEKLVRERPIAAAGIAAIVAMLFAASYLRSREMKLLQWGRPVPVVVTARDVEAGEMLTEELLIAMRFPRRFVASDAIADRNAVSGKVVARVALKKGTPITEAMVVPLGTESGLAVKVEEGKRAVTIPIDEVTGVGGFIRPGDRVDVLASFDFGSDVASRLTTLTLFENIPVLAVGRKAIDQIPTSRTKKKSSLFEDVSAQATGQSTAGTATLLLPPDDAQQLVFAAAAGDVTLTLRSKGEEEGTVHLPPTTIRDVAGTDELLRPRRQMYREYRGR